MAEGLMARVKRMISGSVNSIVDAVENASPETVMREAVREIDGVIDEARSELGVIIANKHHANKRLLEATAKHEDLAEKLRLAVDADRDDLAQAVISRQLDLEAQMPVLEEAVKGAADEQAELEAHITAMVARRREMDEDLQQYLASRDSGPGGTGGDGMSISGDVDRRIDFAENAFNRALRGATGVPGTSGTDRDTAAKLEELEKIARDNRIKERLAAVKATKSGS